MTWIELYQVCKYFFTETEKRGIDPQTIDLKAELDPLLTYAESREKAKSLLDQIAPPQPNATDLLRSELERQLKDTELRVMTEKDVEKLRRLERNADQVNRRVQEARTEKEAEVAKAKEEVARLQKELAEAPSIKLEILKNFREGIVDFYKGQVTETKNRGWALQKIREGLAREVMPEVPTARPKFLTSEEETQLEDTFRAELQASLNKIPPGAISEFRAELDKVRLKPFPEARQEIIGLANEIAYREIKKPRRPFVEGVAPLRPEISPEAGEYVGLPPEFVTPPPKPLPLTPPNPQPFPRAPTTEERALLMDNFRSRLAEKGFDIHDYLAVFTQRILNWPFRSWDELLKLYEELIQDIIARRTIKLIPIPAMPWGENIGHPGKERQDAILHFVSIKLYKTLEELIEALAQWGVNGVTRDEVTSVVAEAKRTSNPWLKYVTDDYLEELLGGSEFEPAPKRNKWIQPILVYVTDKTNSEGMAKEEDVYSEFVKQGASREEIQSAIAQMVREGTLYAPRAGFLRKT
jgi:hypothetical protein